MEISAALWAVRLGKYYTYFISGGGSSSSIRSILTMSGAVEQPAEVVSVSIHRL